LKNNYKAQRNFILRIPNNEEGNTFYKQLKGYLNTNSWAMDRKASGRRTRKFYRNSFNTTMAEADSIRVYLQAKTSEGNVQVAHDATVLGSSTVTIIPIQDETTDSSEYDVQVSMVNKKSGRKKFLGIL